LSSRFQKYVVNVAERPAVEALPAQVIAHFGAVDCIVNNAVMIQPFTRLNNLEYSVIERVFNVNLFGRLFMNKAFLPHLLLRPEAHIVNLSSMGGIVPVPGQAIYGAARAAVKLMSEGLASELLGTNVHVTVLFPGAVAANIRGNSGVEAGSKNDGSGRTNALSPAKAAQIIVHGMERNAPSVLVGRDSMQMDKLHRLARNRLKGAAGNAVNAMLAAAAMNFQQLLRAVPRRFMREIHTILSRLLSPSDLVVSPMTMQSA
jgi:short-subunit dehydrogenase